MICIRLLVVVHACSTQLKLASFVWVEDPKEAWIDVEIAEVYGEDIKVAWIDGGGSKGTEQKNNSVYFVEQFCFGY